MATKNTKRHKKEENDRVYPYPTSSPFLCLFVFFVAIPLLDGGAMKVLLAEDSAVARVLLQAYLENWGHEVTIASDGAQAWRLFEQGDFPIVLTDWTMPEMDGLELIRLIRSSKRRGYVYIIL